MLLQRMFGNELRNACMRQAAWAWATAQSDESTTWHKQARWVEDGHVWTSAGVTAGKLACRLIHPWPDYTPGYLDLMQFVPACFEHTALSEHLRLDPEECLIFERWGNFECAGMDMSLAFLAKQHGESVANQLAAYAEYSADFKDSQNDPWGRLI